MSETADGSTLWVAARRDHRVLAFNTRKLESDPDNALLGYADTGGKAPVGTGLFHCDQLLPVSNSNCFANTYPVNKCPTEPGNPTVLDVCDPSLAIIVQTVPAGLFPREVAVGSDDATLYLANYYSSTLQVTSTSDLQ